MKVLLYKTIIILTLTACSASEHERPPFTEAQRVMLNEGLEQIARDFELMGLAVAYIRDFKLVYEGYTGYAIYEIGSPFDRNAVVRIASPSKSVTTLALMQLYDKGLVNLDEDVSSYLGWTLRSPLWPDTPITLRMLLGHTSGINDGPSYSAFARAMIADRLPLRMLFTGTDGPQNWDGYSETIFSVHEPGTYFSYSNAAWGLVAGIIETVTGERFDRYVRDHIMVPLNIEASFNIADIPVGSIAAIYRYQNDVWTPQIDFFTDGNMPADRGYHGYEPGHNGLIYAPQGGLRISTKGLITLAEVLLNSGVAMVYSAQQASDRYPSGTSYEMASNKEQSTSVIHQHEDTFAVSIISEEALGIMKAEHWLYKGDNGDTWDDFWMSFGLGLHRLTGEPGLDVIFPGMQMIGHPGIAYGLLSDIYVDPSSGTGVIFITNGSKQPFAYGENSSFYLVEEAVFKLLALVDNI